MPSGRICFLCPEFSGSYKPHAECSINYWFCGAGLTDGKKIQVSETSLLPESCPNKFPHALADVQAGRKIAEIQDDRPAKIL
jgi:hypothetical protein